MSVALLCPGQGAQRVGMGKDLAEAFPAAAAVFAAIDDALGFGLSTVMWEGPEELLTRTDHAQPAILAHSAAVWAVVGDRLAPRVAAAAGHSLGEYSAYLLAGSLELGDAVRLVRRRGELMRAAGEARPGVMAVCLGLSPEAVEAICTEASSEHEVVVAANLNEPQQTVVSGDPEAVARAVDLLKAAGARRVMPLKVSGAFHSPLMAPAARSFGEVLAGMAIRTPRFPVVANASATAVRTVGDAKRLLADQLTSPVRWIEVAHRLADLVGTPAAYVEVGPGRVLSGLTHHVLGHVESHTLGTAAEVQAFLEAG